MHAPGPDALLRLVQRATGHLPSSMVALPGGASSRRYLRVATPAGTAVAMVMPGAEREGAAAGAASVGWPSAPSQWPFLEVHALLRERGVRVPAVLAEDCARGLVLLEDLGDWTLAALVEREPARRAEAYALAVRDLARAQRALAPLPRGSVVAASALDATLLRWELDHFRAWALGARGLRLGDAARAEFDAVADRLARRIAAWPRVFVHRDYQSRNLMVLGGPGGGLELAWLDFQDALLGPRAYDLATLLTDCFQDLDRPFIEARLDDYAAAAGLDRPARDALGRELDVIAVQRKLKDAGRFVFLDRIGVDPGYLRYVEPALARARAALERLRDDEDMRALARILAGL
ncbi:aminoglycoside phosphotransferase family protein [Sorangium sp. So ce131]|uniref:aminoglycoside phosphotransferase family protein n=1 Tax=Sorangium sp. So ce131 TaxID=3133282 RepID=UPI003F628EA8